MNELSIIDLAEHIHDFEDTAALMANLDLVISIDTSVAHLAAATGRPTWVLLSHVSEWRWLENRNDSPWYPTVKLFRQSDHGDWHGVIGEVARCLADSTDRNLSRYENIVSEKSHFGPFQERQNLEKQLKEYQNVVSKNTMSTDDILNVGATLVLLARYDEAISTFRHILELDPGYVAAHLNLAYVLLTTGNYLEGWQHFEWRVRRIESSNLPPWPILQQEELGTHLSGTTILVHCEQGFGDTIQFSRFLPLLSDVGYRVIVSCPPQMTALISSIPGVTKVIPHGSLLPICDLQVLLLSLPWLFSVTLETLPIDTPYLVPRDLKIYAWKKRLRPDKYIYA